MEYTPESSAHNMVRGRHRAQERSGLSLLQRLFMNRVRQVGESGVDDLDVATTKVIKLAKVGWLAPTISNGEQDAQQHIDLAAS